MNDNKDFGLLMLRLFFGGLMLVNHGWGKLQKLLDGAPYQFADLFGIGTGPSLGLAVFSEVACAFLIVLGLFTRWASVPLIITMFIAAFYIHGGDPFSDKEHALLFLIPYICLGMMGGGKYSLDNMLGIK